ncbi:MAG TPA: hypothetical protein PKM73_07990 [Verrucomicrobiota bacterium]|nr:hypothetical protein [Verrucomicrobiota bacterium]HNU51772.1 hypothetical protein [Verrucomicrobiota bacterium]
MEPNWAADHLQVIRTLMERSAVYRRALAPMMLWAGALGTAAGAAGLLWPVDHPVRFILFWLAIALVTMTGSFLMVRRQALREAEPFWSPPARRVVRAAAPAAACGLGLALVIGAHLLGEAGDSSLWRLMTFQMLPVIWAGLYGCGMHAAGFFMPRGMRWFGTGMVAVALVLLAAGNPGLEPFQWGHGVMAICFGLLHLGYGAYLVSTERPHAAL